MRELTKKQKSIGMFCIITTIAVTITINAYYQAGISIIPKKTIVEISFVREVDVKMEELFAIMADVRN